MADKWNLGSFVEATAFAALDEVFATFRGDDGFARPSRYEAYFFPPVSKSKTNILKILEILFGRCCDTTRTATIKNCHEIINSPLGTSKSKFVII